jgi:hypothetical protein
MKVLPYTIIASALLMVCGIASCSDAPGEGETAMDEEPPISHDALRDLFERLDRTSMTGYECDHTFSITRKFLRERDLPVEPMIEWLGENGAGCDCEVIMNTTTEWEDIVGYRPPDEDA